MSGTYRFEDYADNWSYWNQEHHEQYPSIPANVHGDVAFAVVNADGTLDPNYPLFPPDPSNPWQQAAPPGCDGFAIGGWNDSQPGGGLNTVLTQASDTVRQALISNIVQNALKYGYNNVVLDYENYSEPPPDPELYTQFLENLGAALHQKGISLEIAISPDPKNQRYYDLKQLVSSGCVDRFHVMAYDYTVAQSAPIKVENNASIQQTEKYLKELMQTVPASKIMVGVPFYGVGYQLSQGMTPQQVQEALQKGSLTATGYTDFGGTATITDDDLLSKIGYWDQPQNGWVKISDGETPPSIYYYNASLGTLVSAMPPESLKDFAAIVKEVPGIAGVFAWEAQGDFKGAMMQELMRDLTG